MAHFTKLSKEGNFLKIIELADQIKKLMVHQEEVILLFEEVSWLA